MKAPRKLKRYISISLGLVALVMIAGYSIFVEYTLISGLVEAASIDLYLAARDFEVQYKDNPDAPLPQGPRLKAFMGEEDLPDWFKKIHPMDTLEHGQLEIADVDVEDFGLGESLLYLVLPHDLGDGKWLYLMKLYTEKDDIPGTFSFSDNAEYLILGIGIGFIILVFGAGWYLFRIVSFSVDGLSDWARNLTPKTLEQPRPAFNFREVDQLADLIQNAMGDVYQALNREHEFLRNASHELRTPIAVIRSNMDLLARLRPEPGEKENISCQRIRRAVDNMHRLTETLLWLSRKEDKMPQPEPVDMDQLVDELVLENQYLLTGKDVDLHMERSPAPAILPLAACRIAIGNLIRNAFQYTDQGSIDIRVTATAVIIENTNRHPKEMEENTGDHGFGVGLMLVEQIAQKLSLHYESLSVRGGHRAILSWHSDVQKTSNKPTNSITTGK